MRFLADLGQLLFIFHNERREKEKTEMNDERQQTGQPNLKELWYDWRAQTNVHIEPLVDCSSKGILPSSTLSLTYSANPNLA